MGVVIPVGFAEVNFRWRVTGDPDVMVCTLGINPAPGDTAAGLALDMHNAASAVGTGFSAAAFMSNQYSLQPTIVRFRTTALPPVVAEAGSVVPGTVDLTELPNNVSILVQKRTGLGGRQNRGRMYLPPYMFTSPAIDGAGTIAAVNVTALQTRMNALDAAITLASRQPVLLHSDGTLTPTVIDQFLVSNVVATQRTRTRR